MAREAIRYLAEWNDPKLGGTLPFQLAHNAKLSSATHSGNTRCDLLVSFLPEARKDMLDKLSLQLVSKIAQRVQRECTGYYCSYTFKGQAIGRKYLLLASRSLDYLSDLLEKKTPQQRMHHVTNKCFSDMFHRCCSRPTAEEYNLSAFWDPHDVTNAEFQRTWQSVAFPGAQLLAKLEQEMSKASTVPVKKILPLPKAAESSNDDVLIKHMLDLYGWKRPS